MNNEFTPYEIALELKRLGFDKPCLGCYVNEKLETPNPDFLDCQDRVNYVYKNSILAPLWQQVEDFLLSKGIQILYSWLVMPQVKGDLNTIVHSWTFRLKLQNTKTMYTGGRVYDHYTDTPEGFSSTRPEARLKAVTEALKLIK